MCGYPERQKTTTSGRNIQMTLPHVSASSSNTILNNKHERLELWVASIYVGHAKRSLRLETNTTKKDRVLCQAHLLKILRRMYATKMAPSGTEPLKT